MWSNKIIPLGTTTASSSTRLEGVGGSVGMILGWDSEPLAQRVSDASRFPRSLAAESPRSGDSSPMPGSWNQIADWLRQVEALRETADACAFVDVDLSNGRSSSWSGGDDRRPERSRTCRSSSTTTLRCQSYRRK